MATGMLEEGGRISLVTGAGPGRLAAPKVHVYNFDLFGRAASHSFPDVRKTLQPKLVVAFDGARSRTTGIAVAHRQSVRRVRRVLERPHDTDFR